MTSRGSRAEVGGTGFFKLSGSGNDFLALADPTGQAPAPTPEQIRAWCRRGVSLGADGLFLLRRSAEGEEGRAVMEYWNADGLPADLCLNGTRCAAQLAFHLGWADGRVRIATAAGEVSAVQLDPTRIAVELSGGIGGSGSPPPRPPREVTLEALGQAWTGWAITVGVPHLVLVWPAGLKAAPVVPLGRALRLHDAFTPAGTNVSFVRFPAANRLEIRTYERGVEDETLSCGTGVLAAAAVGVHLGQARLPLAVLTQGGFELAVSAASGDASGEASGGWSLAGDARIVAAGDLLAAAEIAPPPPAWS